MRHTLGQDTLNISKAIFQFLFCDAIHYVLTGELQWAFTDITVSETVAATAPGQRPIQASGLYEKWWQVQEFYKVFVVALLVHTVWQQRPELKKKKKLHVILLTVILAKVFFLLSVTQNMKDSDLQ